MIEVMVQPPRHKQKGQGCKLKDASPQTAMFNRLGSLAPTERSSLSLSLVGKTHGKIQFCISYKNTQRNINESTSFM